MLRKKEVNVNNIDTLIGRNSIIEGKINAKGTIRFDGTLIGDLIVEGNVIIGEDGKVKGNITCENIIVSGTIEGNVTCKEQLRLTNTASLYGDIEVKSFIVDESAVFEGACKMRDESKNLQNDKDKKNKKQGK